jgi:hypothetical protein
MIADHHLNQLALGDTVNFGSYMKDKGYMNDSYEIVEGFGITEFESICDQFNTRAGYVTPKGGSAQG